MRVLNGINLPALYSSSPESAKAAGRLAARLPESRIPVLSHGNGFPLIRAGAQLQVLLELTPKLFQDADGGQSRGVAQRAKRLAQDIEGHVERGVRVLGYPLAVVEACQQRLQPGCPLAARDTPAAGLVGVEPLDAQQGFHHASILVHDDHAARAQ